MAKHGIPVNDLYDFVVREEIPQGQPRGLPLPAPKRTTPRRTSRRFPASEDSAAVKSSPAAKRRHEGRPIGWPEKRPDLQRLRHVSRQLPRGPCLQPHRTGGFTKALCAAEQRAKAPAGDRPQSKTKTIPEPGSVGARVQRLLSTL
jgi:hypothetical protein